MPRSCPLFDHIPHLANFFRDPFFLPLPLLLAMLLVVPRSSPFHLLGSRTTNKGKFRGRWRFFFDSTLFFVRRISLNLPPSPSHSPPRFAADLQQPSTYFGAVIPKEFSPSAGLGVPLGEENDPRHSSLAEIPALL